MPVFDGPGPHPDPKKLIVFVSPALSAFMMTHAFRRSVSMSELVRDVLRSWIRRATPPDDPIFWIESIGFEMPLGPTDENHYRGYVETLRFNPEPANLHVTGKT